LELFSFNTMFMNNRSDKHIFKILFTNLHHVSFKLKLNSILWNLNLKLTTKLQVVHKGYSKYIQHVACYIYL
jgi:hypothetical protein